MQLKYSNYAAFSHVHGVAVNNSGLIETLWNVKSGEGLGNSERAEWLFLGIYGN